jgi:hypothetical protein
MFAWDFLPMTTTITDPVTLMTAEATEAAKAISATLVFGSSSMPKRF